MSRSIQIVLFLFVCLFSNSDLKATHIIGGEMSYVCLGNDLYQVTILMYRDCTSSNGADFDSAPGAFTKGTVSVFNGTDLSEYRNVELNAPIISELDVATDNPCLVAPPNICVQQGVYTFNVLLPQSSNPYTITYQRCCRNPTISNMINPNTVGSTFSVVVTPEAMDFCNNSPSFNQLPPALVCNNTPVFYDHSASDMDGDSLVYSFCSPTNGASQNNPAPDPDLAPPYAPVMFSPGFSAEEPMKGNPVVSIDPMTGIITGTPNIQGQFVVGVCVEEYRQGVLLSTVRRDFQFNVVECISLLDASLESNVLNGEEHIVYSCNELDVFIENESVPADNIEDVLWEVNIDVDSVYTSSAVDLSVTLPSPGEYSGNLILNPGTTCIDTAHFQIVVAPELIASIEVERDSCSLNEVVLKNTNELPNTTAMWSYSDGIQDEGDEVFRLFGDAGVYEVEMVLIDEIGCVDTVQTIIPWYPLSQNLEIALENVDGCAPLEVLHSSNTEFSDGYNFTWDYGDGSFGDELNGSHIYQDLGNYSLSLLVETPNGCRVERTFDNSVNLTFGLGVPNAFSPNQDGINEEFCIITPCQLDNYSFSVLDTWGSLMFDSKNQNECWEGKFKGQRVVPGVYVWVLNYTDHLGQEKRLLGDITVFR